MDWYSDSAGIHPEVLHDCDGTPQSIAHCTRPRYLNRCIHFSIQPSDVILSCSSCALILFWILTPFMLIVPSNYSVLTLMSIACYLSLFSAILVLSIGWSVFVIQCREFHR